MATAWDPVYGFNTPTVSDEVMDQFRRMTAATPTEYDDEMLISYVLKYPFMDEFQLEPNDISWTPGYDLAAAAADVWSEKAACLATSQYDFSADGASYSRSQMYDQAVAQARYWMSKRAIRPIRLVVDHRYERDMQASDELTYSESVAFSEHDYVINRAEIDDDMPEDF